VGEGANIDGHVSANGFEGSGVGGGVLGLPGLGLEGLLVGKLVREHQRRQIFLHVLFQTKVFFPELLLDQGILVNDGRRSDRVHALGDDSDLVLGQRVGNIFGQYHSCLLQLLLEDFLAALRLLELVEEALNFFGVAAVVVAALTDRRGNFGSFVVMAHGSCCVRVRD